MARPSVSIELSTSRISRLLRPLRTKCIALAAVHPTSSATTSTYGSKPCSVQPHLLEVLPPPDTIRSYHVDHRSVASLRAALYAVRDGFREIVVKTKPAGEFAAGRRVPRLADLCSTIVGQNMEGEEDLPADAEEDSEEFSEMENIEKLYEIIPVQYRRSALLAHSLDIILRFPHHFTLLSILFDVCLQHDLYHESCVLLHLLLRAAVSSASGAGSVPLCHPANSNYLLDLCRKWREADHLTSVFIRMLSTVLVEAPRSEFWGCKALAKFTRELHSQDFQSLIDMASQIVSSLADVQVQEPQRSPTKHRTVGTKKSLLMDQLNVWLNYSSSFPPADSILEFLERCYQSGVHRNSSESLAATVACWATHFLPSASREIHPTIYRLLQDISPTVTTYSLLVRKCLDTKQAAAVKLQDSRTLLQGYAGCLRTNKLLVLEASLWACALRFVETSIGAYDSQHELSLYREELMDLVECAERRCFGSPSACQNVSQSEWDWEESMQCWVLRDCPPAKKAKLHHEPEQRSPKRHDRIAANSQSVSSPLADIQNEVMASEAHHDYTSVFELSFTSLISSALSRRTKLHVQPGPVLRRTCHSPRPRTLLTPHPSDDTIPSSDDALNLFTLTEVDS